MGEVYLHRISVAANFCQRCESVRPVRGHISTRKQRGIMRLGEGAVCAIVYLYLPQVPWSIIVGYQRKDRIVSSFRVDY